MTSPIEKQQKVTSVPAAAVRRDWCCGSLATGPHVAGCAYEPKGPIDYTAPVQIMEPPAANPQPGSAPAASPASEPARQRTYGFRKRPEFDVELPSGSFVRVRQLTMTQVIEIGVLNMKDSFAAELFQGVEDDGGFSQEAVLKAEEALQDPGSREKLFGPLNRVIAAAVVCPTVVLAGPTTDEQINVDEIDLVDKRIIFEYAMPDEMKTAALEAQHDALKRVRPEQAAGLGSVGDGQDIREAAE